MRAIKIINILMILTFGLLLTFFLVQTQRGVNNATIDQYTYFENRTLANPPTLAKESFWSGSYFTEQEEFLKDHFAYRERMMKIYTLGNKEILHKPVVNGIYIGDEQLLPYHSFIEANEEEIEKNCETEAQRLAKLNQKVKSYGGIFLYVGIPEQASYFDERYPFYLNSNGKTLTQTEKTFFTALDQKGIPYLNMKAVFTAEGRPEQYYSASDHHYNMYGAVKTYQTIMATVNELRGTTPLKIYGDDEISVTAAERPFLGSRSRQLMGFYRYNDQLWQATFTDTIPFSRTINGNLTAADLYVYPENPDEPLTYSCYNGGDMGECLLKTNRLELPNLLMYGDSFTNALEPLIYTAFNDSLFLDFRNTDNLTQGILSYVEEYQPAVVLCIRDDTQYQNLDGNGKVEY